MTKKAKVAALIARGLTDVKKIAKRVGCSEKLADYYKWELKNPRHDYYYQRHRRLYETDENYRESNRQRALEWHRARKAGAAT